MNLNVLKHICMSHSNITNTPIKVYKNKELIVESSHFQGASIIDLCEPFLDDFFICDTTINYTIMSDLLLTGFIHCTNAPYSLFIGPMRLMAFTHKDIVDIITSDLYPVSLSDASHLRTLMNGLPHTDIHTFVYTLSYLNSILNHTIIEPDKILKQQAEYDISEDVNQSMIHKDESTLFHGIKRRNATETEADLLFDIRHGLTDRVRDFDDTHTMVDIGTLGDGTLRHLKNSIIILNSLSLRAAVAGGVTPETCYQLGEIYIQKIEACQTIEQLHLLSKNLRLDYAERVRQLHHPDTQDPLINKAVLYIHENVHKKITVKDLSEHLSLSPNYLSSRFRKITGISIVDYVNQEKVIEAKRLLILTKKPLAEISEYLSFSSQSYFQKIFKSIENVTPKYYRENTKLWL